MVKSRRHLPQTVAQVAVVVTVFNEQASIGALVSSLLAQTLRPAEIIITDGGSTDDTSKILQRLAAVHHQLKVFLVPGNRSVGRNYGVSKSSSPIIAFTDAGCQPTPSWLKELARPFSQPSVSVVSGYYSGQATTVFELCLLPFCLVTPDKARATEFYPSTRSMAIRRRIFLQVGGFNKENSHSEDFELAHRLKADRYYFTFAPRALVLWQPRKKLSSAAWMFLRFAYGDMQAKILRPKVKLMAIRYLVFIYLIFLSRYLPILYPVLLTAVIAYLSWAILKNYRYVKQPQAFFWLPVLQLTSDLAVLFGTLLGLLAIISSPTKKP